MRHCKRTPVAGKYVGQIFRQFPNPPVPTLNDTILFSFKSFFFGQLLKRSCK